MFTADYLDYQAEWARRYEGEIIQSDRPRENILLFKRPLGVIAGILPWNFPFFLIARKMGPALVTGNTIVVKPSSITPINCHILLKSSMPQAYRPAYSTSSTAQAQKSAMPWHHIHKSIWSA